MQYRTLTGLTQSTIQADRIYSSLLEATFREEQIRIASLTPKGMRRIVENNQTQFRQYASNRALTHAAWAGIGSAVLGYLLAVQLKASLSWFSMFLGLSAGAFVYAWVAQRVLKRPRLEEIKEGNYEAVRSSGKEISVSALDDSRAKRAKAIFRNEGALLLGLTDSSVTAFRPPI
jgi:hypothetical protein